MYQLFSMMTSLKLEFFVTSTGDWWPNLPQDMMMFTQQETLFVALPDNFVTGRAKTRCRDLLNLGGNEV